MPASSDKQRRFMGAELGRKRKGQKTETGMSEDQLRDFASKSVSAKAKPMPKGGHGKHGSMGKHASMQRGRDKKHAAKKMGTRKHGY